MYTAITKPYEIAENRHREYCPLGKSYTRDFPETSTMLQGVAEPLKRNTPYMISKASFPRYYINRKSAEVDKFSESMLNHLGHQNRRLEADSDTDFTKQHVENVTQMYHNGMQQICCTIMARLKATTESYRMLTLI